MTVYLRTASEWLEIVRDWAFPVAAVLTAVTAMRALGTWRREIRGKAEYELARNFLRAVYHVRQGVDTVRNHVRLVSEFPESHDFADDDPEAQYQANLHIYESRIDVLYAALVELETQRLEAHVLWGPKIDELVQPLRDAATSVQPSIEQHLVRIKSGETARSAPEWRKIRADLYGEWDRSDRISKKVDESVRSLESFLKAHLRR